ncbi:hypothetical protein LCGC14_0965030 [marine sediment metagenome]|uniref:Portal protein n=1 Tax=marine sediment metagenome TaxID=412755 RepID=A0A0F9RJW4_9ZZZZ
MADIDYRELAKQTRTDWGGLFTRIYDDNEMINLAKYTLLDTDGKEIPNALSLTLNDFAVFVNKVETALGDSEEKLVVETEDKNLDTSKVETVIKAMFRGGDKLLANQQESPLDMAIDQQNCRAGGSAAKVIFNVDAETGELTPQIRSLNRIGLTFASDTKGVTWTSYLTKRSRTRILSEYPDVESYLRGKETDIEVEDIWSREHNEVWVNGHQVWNRENLFKNFRTGEGYVPIVIRIVPMGSTYGDIKFWGESLLLLIRTIMPELNRLLSIAQSLNQKELDHALQLKVEEEDLDGSDPPEHDNVTNPRKVTKVGKGGGFDIMPLGELRQQAWQLYQAYEARMQRGGANAFDLGTFSQTMSFIALAEVAEGREQIYLPRLNTRGLLKDGIAEMGVDQILTSGLSEVKLGGQTYKVSDLKGEYDIKHKYTNKSSVKDAARWQMYAAIGNGLSERSKLEKVIELEDVDGEIRQKKIEEAEILFVSVKKARAIRALAEEADAGSEQAKIELELALQELEVTLDQIMAGDIEPEQGIPKEPQKPNPLALSNRGGGSQALNNGGNENG